MVTSSVPKSKANIWTTVVWAICTYLVFELGMFIIVKYIAHAGEGELLGPYLALAVPGVIFLLVVGWLWKWEELGQSPRWLAYGWGLSIALFFLSVCAALFYSSVKLRIIDPSDAVGVFGLMVVGGTLSGFLGGYTMTLRRIFSKNVVTHR